MSKKRLLDGGSMGLIMNRCKKSAPVQISLNVLNALSLGRNTARKNVFINTAEFQSGIRVSRESTFHLPRSLRKAFTTLLKPSLRKGILPRDQSEKVRGYPQKQSSRLSQLKEKKTIIGQENTLGTVLHMVGCYETMVVRHSVRTDRVAY